MCFDRPHFWLNIAIRVMECWVCSPEAVTQLFRLQLGFSQPFTSKAEQDILADKMKWLVIIWKPYFYQVNHWCFLKYFYFCNELKNQGVSFEDFPLGHQSSHHAECHSVSVYILKDNYLSKDL